MNADSKKFENPFSPSLICDENHHTPLYLQFQNLTSLILSQILLLLSKPHHLGPAPRPSVFHRKAAAATTPRSPETSANHHFGSLLPAVAASLASPATTWSPPLWWVLGDLGPPFECLQKKPPPSHGRSQHAQLFWFQIEWRMP